MTLPEGGSRDGDETDPGIPPDGMVVPVDKPVGPTSHDMVARLRKVLGERRIGHTGTLDPFASGLLLLPVGPATRISQYLTGLDKSYVAEARLGIRTTTHDPEGEIVGERRTTAGVSPAEVEAALAGFRGTIEQRPPAFSAKKVRGEAAHRRARRGEAVELPSVEVTVHDLELAEVDLPRIRFRVTCSSGTYVRALARDVGEALGTGAHLTTLRRTAVGAFRVEDAVSGDALTPGMIHAARIPAARALGHLPRVEVGEEEVRRLAHGQRIPGGEGLPPGPAAVVREGRLVAVAQVQDGRLQPRKVFA